MSAERDVQAAHQQFAVECFNQTWLLIEKPDRTPEEATRMVALAMASLWHWTQRADVTPRNLSVGYWQVSRVLALVGDGFVSRSFAQQCLEHSRGEEAFYLAYAYEALARAACVLNETAEAERWCQQARSLVESLTDAASQQQLLADLQTILSTS